MGLINTLQGIGDAIREKAGTNERIPLKSMAEVILNLSGGANCKSAVYNEDDTITLIDNNDNEHIIKCVYGNNGLESVTYDDEIIEIDYDEGALIRVADIQIDMSKIPVTNGESECVEYDSVIYNEDNTVTLTEVDGTVHIMTCEYDGDKIVGFTYDDDNIKLVFDGDKLVKVDNMDIDVDNMPVSSGGASECVEYDSVIYNDDNTVTLTESDGTVHTMTLNYNDENRIAGVMYDDEAIEVGFVDGKLGHIDGMEVDLSNIPTTSGGTSKPQVIVDSSVASVILPVTIPTATVQINTIINADSSAILEE